ADGTSSETTKMAAAATTPSQRLRAREPPRASSKGSTGSPNSSGGRASHRAHPDEGGIQHRSAVTGPGVATCGEPPVIHRAASSPDASVKTPPAITAAL